MKNKCFLPLLAALAISTATMAQVSVQPVKDVHTVVIEDAVSLKVYIDSTRGTVLEVSSNTPVARVSRGVMYIKYIKRNNKAVLRMAPDCPINQFTVQDAGSLEFVGAMDFGDKQLIINTEEAGKVRMTKVLPTDTIKAGEVILHTEDGSRIVGDVPLSLTDYDFHAEDASYIELPSIDLKPGTNPQGRTYHMTQEDGGKIKVLGHVAYFDITPFVSSKDSLVTTSDELFDDDFSSSPDRDEELNIFWGFNNWGSKPFVGFGGMNGDAELSSYFMNLGLSIDFPVLDEDHFGLYIGLGVDGNMFHFDSPLVNYTGTGFQSSTTSNMVQITGASELNNWDTYFNTVAVTLPVTFSFEPWSYDGLCLRLSAIPGINLAGTLEQQYNTKSVQVSAKDPLHRKQLNTFMLDTRLTLLYNNFGLYVQTATLPLLKRGNDPFYPVKFGIFWCMAGR